MNLNAIEAILLFAITIPVVMGYRILPIDGTPYWLFGLLFLTLTLNLVISAIPILPQAKLLRVKEVLIWVALVIAVGGATVTAIVDRNRIAPVHSVHDIILQQEAAIRFILTGKNPYKETYFGTPLESFRYAELGRSAVNPALYHFVMPPWYLLFALPFYFLALPILGYFDGRFPLLFSLVGLLFILRRWFKNRQLGILAMTLTAASPAVVHYFIEGRSDIMALFFLVWALYLLEKKKFLWSAVMLALGLATKQTIWFITPFYLVYLYLGKKRSWQLVVAPMVAILLTLALVVGPFILWDARALADSTVFYLTGNTPHSYPISGYGLGMLLYERGLISDIHAPYPFILWQLALGGPVLLATLWWLVKKPTISRLLLSYAFSLLVWWYLSRYFNNSHLGYLSSLFVLGVLKAEDETV